MQRPRLLVVDDNDSIVDLVTILVREEYEIVGTARDGGAAIEGAIHLQPDVIVLDLSIPTLNGLQVARRLRANNHFAPIVLLTMVEDAELVRMAHAEGVLGYVSKRRMQSDLVPALRCVL